jgi:hypothetical protein
MHKPFAWIIVDSDFFVFCKSSRVQVTFDASVAVAIEFAGITRI